ncbi:uro-adherence factor A-like [Macrobrachium rosenbergii]|uniref:uro-adherence factor A-like n=1 Tax=Macrobrachium rosenbergii TaxID=79674 RepID=UPI0034D4FC62
MGGKAKWRKLKRVVGPVPQGSQAPAKQHFKKERTKTRDAKRRRMGDGGEEEDDEADAAADGSKKEPKSPKDPSAKPSTKKGQEPSKGRTPAPSKAAAKPSDAEAPAEDKKEPEAVDTSQTKAPDLIQEANGLEEPPEVMVTDLDKDLEAPQAEGLEKPKTEEMLKEEIREATEEEPKEEETKVGRPVKELKIDILESPSQEIAKELTPTQKSTQTDAVNMNNVDKPVKFFISDDSDSDTAIFVDANQGALNGANGQPQENAVGSPTKEADIAINAVIDVGGESTVEVTVEGQDIEVGIEEASGTQVDGTAVTQLIDVEPSESPKTSTVQRARFLPSLAETQKMQANLRRHGQSKLAFDPLAEGDNVSRSSASDSVETVSVTRSSVSDLADQDNISKTSTSESADQDGQRKCSTSESVDLDTTSVTSESIEHETVSKVSVTESGEQETMTISESASKMSTTIESAERGTISKSSTRGSISASESAEPDATSRTSVSESAEGQSKTSYSEYEEAEGVTRTSASESGEPDSTSRTSVSESAEFDGTSRTSVSESAEEQSKTSASATATSTSATGEYVTSKSSVSYSSEFDAESLSSTADLLTPKEEVSLTADGKAEQGLDDSSKLEKESPTLTSDTQEKIEERPASPAWEELNLEDNMQLTEEGVISEESPAKGEKKETEADAESVFFSLYPEYQPGEIDGSQDAAADITEGNPKVLCFRGQTSEQSETQEEIYMAAEKSGTKEGRNKGTVSGKIHQLQRKLSTQKKPEREDKEVAEPEGPAAQQGGASSFEQQDAAEQKPEGSPEEGGPEPSPDSAGGKPLPDVPDGATPPSTTPPTDAEKAEHAVGKKEDDLVCVAGQLGEGIEKLADAAEAVVESITELVQTDVKPSELIAEIGQEAMEGDKLEGNAKDRKTLVGKARDWIKGVTRMGGKKEDANGKLNDKPDAKKAEADSRSEAASTDEPEQAKDEKHTPEQEEPPPVAAEASEEEKQSGESDSTATKDNGVSLEEQAAETESAENADAKAESVEDMLGAEQEKGETEPTKESPTEERPQEPEEKPEETEPESKEEGLFDIVGPEEELSDTVFKDDTVDEAGKGKDSDDTEVPDMKTEESAGTEEEKIATPDKVSLTEALEPTEQPEEVAEEEGKEVTETGDEKEVTTGNGKDTEETETKEAEPQFVSAEEGNGTEGIPVTQEVKAEAAQETVEKRRKGTKDEKSRRKRHDKSKSKSPHAEGEKDEKASRKDKEGKSVSKKRRHRKRTKSQEDPAQAPEEPRPEDVPLPPDDFEAEPSPERKPEKETKDLNGKEEDLTAKDEVLEETTPAEKKKVSSKSRERKHSRKSEEKSGEATATEHKRHSRSKREKSSESKHEKKDKEKSEKDTQKSKDAIESPREKLPTEGEVQPSTWSPRVDRKERKSSRKSSERKREGHSTDKPKIPKEKKEDLEPQISEKAADEVCDDESGKKSPKPLKKKSKKPPELSLTITEPRDDTPIPSPKSLSQEFKLDASGELTSEGKPKDASSTETQPLLPTLSFPPGVSKPLSPLPPTKELKFPPGVSKPLSPLPTKTHAPKPIPAPLVLKPESELIVPPSPLKTLTFPEGVTKPISPLPKKIPQAIPKQVYSSLDTEKPLPYPAKPVSPLKMLHFPEGIPKPISPLTKKPQEPAFTKLASAPKTSLPDIADKDIKAEPEKADVPAAKEEAEEAPAVTSVTKKPRPRITIPKPEAASSQAAPASPEPAKPASPFTLKFPEGISQPVSPDPQKSEQPIFKLAEKTEKLSPDAVPVPDSTKKDLPMREPAKPVSPLKIITFPEGISQPISPTPEKETKPLFKPVPTKPIPPALVIPKTGDEISEPSVSQEEKTEATETAPSVSQVPAQKTETLTVLTFPEGVSKPVSPMPQKTKFATDIFKTGQQASPTADLFKTTPVEKPPSPPKEPIKQPLIPSDFFKTVHPGEKPPSLLRPKTTSPAKEMLKTSETDTTKITSPGRTSPLKTFKFPEGVSKPLSPLPPKAKAPETQKEQIDSSIPVPSSQERHTVFTFSHFAKPGEGTKIAMPASPTLQKSKLSEPISPSPIKIKHTVDFPSDVFPCTKASSPLIKSASSPTKTSIPSPKICAPLTQVTTMIKDTSPLPKISSPLAKTPPVLPKSEEVAAAEESPKSETKVPKSILSTRLRISTDTTPSPEKSPRTPSETKSAISQTHLTYSEVSKRFTPSPRLPDEICKEITATPPMTPPPEPEQPSSAASTPKEKSTKIASAMTSEVRSAARYSRGEAKPSKGTPPSSEAGSVTKDKSESTSESKADSVPEISTVRRLHDLQKTEEDSQSAKDGAQSPRSGCDSPSKKLRRRKRR